MLELATEATGAVDRVPLSSLFFRFLCVETIISYMDTVSLPGEHFKDSAPRSRERKHRAVKSGASPLTYRETDGENAAPEGNEDLDGDESYVPVKEGDHTEEVNPTGSCDEDADDDLLNASGKNDLKLLVLHGSGRLDPAPNESFVLVHGCHSLPGFPGRYSLQGTMSSVMST